jgi:hypothetical protein
MMGGLPEGRTPLNLRKTGMIDRGDYRIEKIVYESLPNFYVTANLYVPQTGTPPYPAVLQPVGHSPAAKARAFYQNLGLGLVKNGFVVLTYDPTGQGERRIYYDAALGDSKVGGPTVEHEMAGIQSLLAGESIARYMVWDGMRSIDDRDASLRDAKRIGISGCSGGGTLTAYLAALDDRLQAAARPATSPVGKTSCWARVHRMRSNSSRPAQERAQVKLRPRGSICAETVSHRVHRKTSSRRDRARRSRRASGFTPFWALPKRSPRRCGPTAPPTPAPGHLRMDEPLAEGRQRRDLSRPALPNGMSEGPAGDPPARFPRRWAEKHRATLNMRRLARLRHFARPFRTAGTRSLPGETKRRDRAVDPLRSVARAACRGTIEQAEQVTGCPHLPSRQARGRRVGALLAEPQADNRGADYSLRGRTRQGGAPGRRRYRRTGAAFDNNMAAVDPSGIGETAAQREKITWLALMVGKPLAGLRVDDLLRGIDLLAEKGLLFGGVCFGIGKGLAASDLLHAAVMDSRIAGVAIEGGLLSYASIARTPIHRQISSAVIPGVLGRYDLPDLVAVLAPRPLLVNLRSALGTQVFCANGVNTVREPPTLLSAPATSSSWAYGGRAKASGLTSAVDLNSAPAAAVLTGMYG